MGLVETHEKYKKVEWMDGVRDIAQRREMSDKKGGGMLMITRVNKNLDPEKIEGKCVDVLVGDLGVSRWQGRLALVYMDTIQWIQKGIV